MIKKSIFFVLMMFFILPVTMEAQFNTLLPKKKLEVKKQEETVQPVVEDQVMAVDTTSNVTDEVKFEDVMPVDTVDSSLGIESLLGYIYLPLDTIRITSRYGKRTPPCKGAASDHKGIDLGGNRSMIHSVMAGRVKRVGSNRSMGNFIVIEHGDFVSIYAHLSTTLVFSKQSVMAGQIIGITGSTGVSTGDHLHFSLKYKNEYMDPEPFILLAQKINALQGK